MITNKEKYKVEGWLSFYDIITMTFPISTFSYLESGYDLESFESWLKDVGWASSSDFSNMTSKLLSYSPEIFKWASNNTIYVSQNYVNDLWRLLKFRYKHEFIFPVSFYHEGIVNKTYYDSLSSDEKQEILNGVFEFVNKFTSIIRMTYDRYTKLLDIYTAERDNLLNKVEAITRFNDTPQDSGEFSDDPHTTNITSVKNDYDTLMGRIDEIDRAYRNVMKDWAEEFSGLFIEEGSL